MRTRLIAVTVLVLTSACFTAPGASDSGTAGGSGGGTSGGSGGGSGGGTAGSGGGTAGSGGGTAGSGGGTAGSGGGTASGDAGTPLPVDQFCEAIAETKCSAFVACNLVLPAEKRHCLLRIDTDCRRLLPYYVDFELAYDANVGRQCVDAMAARGCNNGLSNYPTACNPLFSNRNADAGQRCDNSYSGPRCHASIAWCSQTPTTCGVCVAHQPPGLDAGSFCDDGALHCRPETYCSPPRGPDGGPPPDAGFIRTCETLLTDGELFFSGAQCASGTLYGAVDGGTRCGTLAPGAACLVSGCQLSHYCSDAGICAARTALGQPCTDSNSCAEFGRCLSGICRPSSWTGQPTGADCSNTENCPGTDFCGRDAGNYTCTPRLAQGSACGSNEVCARGLECRTGYCLPLAGPNALCDPPACRPLLRCTYPADGGTGRRCQVSPVVGEECRDDETCLSTDGGFAFCKLSGNKGICSPLLTGGAACSSETVCASRLCIAGTCRDACP